MRVVLDSAAVISLVHDGLDVPAEHELLAPTLLRSQTLADLHAAVARGELADEEARAALERIWKLPIRLLGDAVLRRLAWRLAGELGISTCAAEYVALTKLQADALVTLDPGLARAAAGTVETVTLDEITRRSR